MFVQFSEFFHVSLDALILGIDLDKLQECEQDMNLKADIADLIERLKLLYARL